MICVFGSINMDLIASMDRLPGPGETVTGDAFSTAPGGKGANQALAAKRAGADVQMAGAVGNDNFADASIALLRDAGTDLALTKTVDGPTGTALILVGGDGENMIAVVAGANGHVDGADAERVVGAMSDGDSLLLQMEIDAKSVESALKFAAQKNIRSMFNIAPMTADTPQLAPLAKIIIANETEFDLLIGKGTLETTSRREEMVQYCEKHNCSLVITLGAEGVIAQYEGQYYEAKGLSINPVDTVGAGDTFCGYLAQGLDAGLEFGLALNRAAIAGSLACLKPGAQPSIPTSAEVDAAR